jgi:ABC-2 type transport system permease protein
MGNPWLFIGLCILFAFSGLALGTAISVISQTQMQAQLLATLFNLSGMFLAGFLFPAYALPPFLRTLGYIFPLKYFIPIARGIYSKGVGLSGFWVEVTGLSLLLVVIIAAASRLFHQSLE